LTRPEKTPYPLEQTIECHILSDSGNGSLSDFWKASPDGRLFLLRAYQEDFEANAYKPGSVFDLIIPIIRIGECVLHSYRLASSLTEEDAVIKFKVNWSKLRNRKLVSWAKPMYHVYDRVCRSLEVTSEYSFSRDSVQSKLPEIVGNILFPLYESFNFFNIPKDTIINELKLLQRMN